MVTLAPDDVADAGVSVPWSGGQPARHEREKEGDMSRALRRFVAVPLLIATCVLPAVSSATPASAESTATSSAAAALAWQPLSGDYLYVPTALSTGNVVFGVAMGFSDVAGPAFYHEFTGGSWSAPIPLGGFILGIIAPAEPLLEPQKENWEIFGIGVDEAVWYRTRDTGWQSLGGLILSSPTAVTWQGQTYVFGLGEDEAVWYRTPTTGWQSLGGRLASDLAVTTDGTSLYVLGIAEDGSLWSQRRTGSTWSGWQGLGGDAVTSPTATVLSGTGYVFVVGTDGGLWYQGVSGGTWSGWYTLGGLVGSAPAPIGRAGGLDVFVLGEDTAMYSQRWNGTSWSGWRSDGGLFFGRPAATTTHVVGLAAGADNRFWAAAIV